MAPTILVAGATGNTGVGVVRALSADAGGFAVLATTRSASGTVARELAALPNVTVVEQDWTLIDAAWLRSRNVERVFVASPIGVSQFQDESLFLNAALEAGVKYVVRVSTTTANVGPATPAFYGRNHWAVETMLAAPEFARMGWTSLQPNGFTAQIAAGLTPWLSAYKKTGQMAPLGLTLDEHQPVAFVDGAEVGAAAGALLALPDPAPHAGRRYTLVGPQDVRAADLVALLEKHAGAKIEQVTYRDNSWVPFVAQAAGFPRNVWESLGNASIANWDGRCSLAASPTSPEIMELRAPRNKALDQIDAILAAVQ